jgi:hypothetical protein
MHERKQARWGQSPSLALTYLKEIDAPFTRVPVVGEGTLDLDTSEA